MIKYQTIKLCGYPLKDVISGDELNILMRENGRIARVRKLACSNIIRARQREKAKRKLLAEELQSEYEKIKSTLHVEMSNDLNSKLDETFEWLFNLNSFESIFFEHMLDRVRKTIINSIHLISKNECCINSILEKSIENELVMYKRSSDLIIHVNSSLNLPEIKGIKVVYDSGIDKNKAIISNRYIKIHIDGTKQLSAFINAACDNERNLSVS